MQRRELRREGVFTKTTLTHPGPPTTTKHKQSPPASSSRPREHVMHQQNSACGVKSSVFVLGMVVLLPPVCPRRRRWKTVIMQRYLEVNPSHFHALHTCACPQMPSHTMALLSHSLSHLSVTPSTTTCSSKSTSETPIAPRLKSLPMSLPTQLTCRKSIDARHSNGYRIRASDAKGWHGESRLNAFAQNKATFVRPSAAGLRDSR